MNEYIKGEFVGVMNELLSPILCSSCMLHLPSCECLATALAAKNLILRCTEPKSEGLKPAPELKTTFGNIMVKIINNYTQ